MCGGVAVVALVALVALDGLGPTYLRHPSAWRTDIYAILHENSTVLDDSALLERAEARRSQSTRSLRILKDTE